MGRFQDLRLQMACTLHQTDHIIVNIQINVASLSAYCVRACKIKHFTEREFFLRRGGEFCVLKTGIPGGPDLGRLDIKT